MKISRIDLKEALDAIKAAVSFKEIIEHSDSFAFLDGRVFSYNDEISMSHPVPNLGIEGIIKAEELHKLLSKIKQEEIDVSITENELLVKFGKARAGLGLVKDTELPLGKFDITEQYMPVGKEFISALRFTAPNCSTDMTKPMLTCVHIRADGWMEASTDRRIARHKFPKVAISSVLLPSHLCTNVIQFNPTGIQQTEGWLHFMNEKGTTLSCRIFEEGYPSDEKVQSLMNFTGAKDLIFPQQVFDIIDRASIFGVRNHITDNEITLQFDDRELIVHARNDSGWYKEKSLMRYKGEGLSVSLSPEFMFDILNKTLNCRISANKIGFKGDDWEFVSALKVEK
jgi:DNA polymerase III sliding clamp (beta) subunit (PCNA family)